MCEQQAKDGKVNGKLVEHRFTKYIAIKICIMNDRENRCLSESQTACLMVNLWKIGLVKKYSEKAKR